MRLRLDTLAGAALALSPTPFLIAAKIWRGSWPGLAVLIVVAATLLLLLSALVRARRSALLMISTALLGCGSLLWPTLRDSPLLGLVTAVGALALVDRLLRRSPLYEAARLMVGWRAVARGASLGAIALWLLTALAGWQLGVAVAAAVLISEGVGLVTSLLWLLGGARPRLVLFLAAVGLATLVALGRWGQWAAGLGAIALVLGLVAWWTRRSRAEGGFWEPLLDTPQRLLALTFLALCAAGTASLALPVAHASGEPFPMLDAAFTAVSAVCVTGLAVKDTAADFSGLGQALILLLIQAGGLGMMTFSTAAMRLLGRRLSLRREGAVAGLLSGEDRGRLYVATQQLLLFTFVAEALGTLLLWPAFIVADGWARGLWRALFTAVSAFCNAGFALQSDSMTSFQRSPWVLHVVGALIVAGALSPGAALALRQLRGARPLGAQHKLALTTTALLLLVGAVVIGAIEWDGALAGLSVGDRLHNAWFQSVTLRTAGFNSVDFSALTSATLTLMMVWMAIGGNPGGTAGGIKTTTISVLVLGAVTAVRGSDVVTVFGREVPRRTVYRAAAIATVALLVTFLALLALQLTQDLTTRLLSFEVVSALGTVGLSVGATSRLDGVGRVVIMICMFIGRIGSLTLFMFLSQRAHAAPWRYPEEEIDVG